MVRYLYIFCIAFFLAGCGQKGPLYLPPEKTSDASH